MLSEKQKELDKIKWDKSVQLGRDACGSFDYCIKCDMKKENPCENAFNIFHEKKCIKPIAKKTATKTVATKNFTKKIK